MDGEPPFDCNDTPPFPAPVETLGAPDDPPLLVRLEKHLALRLDDERVASNGLRYNRGPMTSLPQTASVVIPCFNYARFVGNAIDSALGQTRPPLEVIVVDDGSRDGSRDVIRNYGQKVRPVFKENGGMASAINAGCRLASGDVIFLLDADDLLCPDAVETVLAQWRSGTVMTQSRLAMADAEGRRVHGTTPPSKVPLAEGDVRAAMLTNGSYSVTLTSGLALHRQALLAVLPIPEDPFRGAADGYLVRAMPFQGPIQAVDRPLALYRRHGNSDSGFGDATTQMGVALRKRIGFIRNELNALEAIAAKHGFEVPPNLCERNPDYLFARLSSLVTDPQNHPVSGDTRWQLWPRIIRSVLRAPSPPALRRWAGVGVASAVVVLPPRLGARLVAWWFEPATRPGWLVRLVSGRRIQALRHGVPHPASAGNPSQDSTEGPNRRPDSAAP
jgi:glycosyltransferase involved in cell wall biosynthesis